MFYKIGMMVENRKRAFTASFRFKSVNHYIYPDLSTLLIQNKMKVVLVIFAGLLSAQLDAQVIMVPMEAKYWDADSTEVQFFKSGDQTAVKPKKSGFQIFLKDQVFTSGTIEYDVELTGIGFPGINFRMSADKKNGDNFYIRSFGKTNPLGRNTLQYAAIIDGTSMWDLSDEYQSGAVINQVGRNHVKLVISGREMKAYVNDMTHPALLVPKLEGANLSGSISLSGNVIYSNFKIIPGAIAGLSPDPGMDLTENDTRYLRKWQVTGPIDFPFGKEIIIPLPSAYGSLVKSELPDSNTVWKPIESGYRAMVNLSRIYPSGARDQRRLAWLKTTIHSDKDRESTLHFGFSDEVWVFVNGQILYVDKNYFGTPEQKEPRGRCTIDNSEIKIPLNQGENVILIALANYFYGWGIVARLESTDGLLY